MKVYHGELSRDLSNRSMYLLKILSRQFCGIKVQEGIRNVSDPLLLFV
nr:MAG TPA: hypothetical protein [Caudoviricetes sp.]DAV43051.1 MAG TPA: hypothetical protein [Caudoviricetes sp.]DAW09566.1 MAG TPA: hypothetical protein [Caudoviricetes sp.]